MTTLTRLLAQDLDPMGYYTYVFEILDPEEIKRLDSKYIMCTRFPNWNCRNLENGDEGFLEFVEIRAGMDKWFDGKNMVPYNYNNVQFLKFVDKPIQETNEFRMLINFKKNYYEEFK